jgi:glycosyltransferase involved in cell wall biosynthesis
MNKLMEYMMLGKPVVAFRLKETLISGGDAVVYCTPTTAAGMANQVIALADDASRRRALGLAGRRRIDDKLGWQHQEAALASVYQKLFPGLRAVSARP